MNSSNCLRRILMNITKPKFNQIIYNNQYETRDFISSTQRVNYDNIINYYKTESFKNYKPNFKSYYEN